MGDDQAGLPEEKIEGKVLQTVEGVSSRENGEAAVSHEGDVPDIPDSRPGILEVHGDYLGIDCCKKAVVLENFGTNRRESALGEDHDGIMPDARPRFMISHSGTSQLGSGMQDLWRSRSKLGCRVVTAMN